jgi:hypothetical protein
LFGGLVVALGLVALEAFAPKLPGTSARRVRLDTTAISDLGIAIDVPRRWTEDRDPVDGQPAVTFSAPATAGDTGRQRGFRVVIDDRTFDQARRQADRRVDDSEDEPNEITIVDDLEVDGSETFRLVFFDDEEFREEWWLEREGAAVLIEFWSPASEREEAAILNGRIANSFRFT